jgi:hypothetical protein
MRDPQKLATDVRLKAASSVVATENQWRSDMLSKSMNYAVITGLLVALAAPVAAYADDAAPKTKAECLKKPDMKWDKATKTCVKK